MNTVVLRKPTTLLLLGLQLAALLTVFIAVLPQKASAACASLPTTYGTVTTTVDIQTAGTYRVWSRIMAPDATNNSYYLQIDETTCGVVVGDSSIAANTWTWVDYQNGTSSSKINVTLSAGTHTVTMIGREPSVEVDRLIFTQDTSCVPTVGTVGDNCANPADTTAPSVSISSPVNNATLTGSTSVAVVAADDVSVSRVELYVDGALFGTDTSSPYSFTLNPSSMAAGQHTLRAMAYDSSNNPASSSTITVTVPDTSAPTNVTLTTPTNGQTVSGTIAVTATAADNVGITKMEFYVDNATSPLATDNAPPYTTSLNTTTLSNGTHTLKATAYDAANNRTSATITVTVNNATTPPADTTDPVVSIDNPANSATISGTYTVSAVATDNVGVTKVEFYVDGSLKATDTSAQYTYSLATSSLSNGTHTISARAYDAADNMGTSATVHVTVSNNTSYLPEDINQDGRVNLLDFSLLASKYGQTGSSLGRTDINGDGVVNLLDFSRLAAKYGQ